MREREAAVKYFVAHRTRRYIRYFCVGEFGVWLGGWVYGYMKPETAFLPLLCFCSSFLFFSMSGESSVLYSRQ